MSESIFSYLKSYTPSVGRDPKEDYLTQLFAWILEFIPGVGKEYLDYICSKNANIVIPGSEMDEIEVETQKSILSGRIDLFLSIGKGCGIICEHKVHSALSENQISKYMQRSDELENRKLYSVLVTFNQSQHTQAADVSLIWSDIYELIEGLIDSYEGEHKFVLSQFLLYLEENGMGKVNPISMTVVENYFSYFELNNRLSAIFNRLMQEDWKALCPEIENIAPEFALLKPKYKDHRWGRKGIDFLGEDWYPLPGLFAGIIYDGYDHVIYPVDESKGPDFVVLLDYVYGTPEKDNKRQKIVSSAEYMKLSEALRTNHSTFDLFLDKELKNKWRIALLRKPLIDIMKDAGSAEEQYQAVLNAVVEGIKLLCQVDFRSYKDV